MVWIIFCQKLLLYAYEFNDCFKIGASVELYLAIVLVVVESQSRC